MTAADPRLARRRATPSTDVEHALVPVSPLSGTSLSLVSGAAIFYRRRGGLSGQPVPSTCSGAGAVLTSAYNLIDPTVLNLARALRDRGLLADVQVLSVCGDPDVRLVACRDGADVTVELLGSLAADRPADRWQAVRVRGEDRQVWCGPPHDAPATEVVGFVEALLILGADHLAYPRLG